MSRVLRPVRHIFCTALAAASLVSAAGTVLASSHREGPGITKTPKVDATDFYFFRSYESGRNGFSTVIANYQPFQSQYGGPNFFQMDSDALYQIHFDSNADAKEDITFTFRFSNALRDLKLNVNGPDVPVALTNISTIGPEATDNAALNVVETYTVDVTFGDRYLGTTFRLTNFDTGEAFFRKPVDFIGNKSIPNYEDYARKHIARARLPGVASPCKIFVGQRKDSFVVNLGEIFDLVNLNPVGANNAKADSLKDSNVTSICMEIPSIFLRASNSLSSNNIVGAWTTASLPRFQSTQASQGNFTSAEESFGPWRQVSRLAMPLVNEVVIGLRDKNRFNNSQPRNDGQFATYVTNPTLPAILGSIFQVGAPCTPRNDLVSVFLTGVAGLNKPLAVTPSEMMRLNLDIAPKAKGQQNNLGVLGADTSGFPNGRRPGDDVVDIELRVVMGVLYPDAGQSGGCAPAGLLPLTDGAFIDDSRFDDRFPYLRTPVTGSPNTDTP